MVQISPTIIWYGVEYIVFTANDSSLTTNSNNITLTVIDVEEPRENAGSGGGGGSSTVTKVVNIDIKEEDKEAEVILRAKEKARFVYSGAYHTVTPTKIGKDYVIIEIASTVKTATLRINESKKFNLDIDNYYDIYVKLNNIIKNKVNLTIKRIHEQILPTGTLPKAEEEEIVEVPEEILPPIEPEEGIEKEELKRPSTLSIIKNKLSSIKNIFRKIPSKLYVFALIVVAISSLIIFSFKLVRSRKVPADATYRESVIYNYIKKELKKGFKKKTIRKVAIKAGWKKETVDKMFKKL